MKTYIQDGDVLDLTAPVGGLVSGQGYLFNNLFAVATTNIAAGEKGACCLEGVYSLPKVAAISFSEGDFAYWDGSQITDDDTNDFKIGHVTEDTAADATVIAVRLLS
jgi:predicted RecA/RadA family phage recombinase